MPFAVLSGRNVHSSELFHIFHNIWPISNDPIILCFSHIYALVHIYICGHNSCLIWNEEVECSEAALHGKQLCNPSRTSIGLLVQPLRMSEVVGNGFCAVMRNIVCVKPIEMSPEHVERPLIKLYETIRVGYGEVE